MVGADGALAIIPSDCFRWRPRVQFIETYRTRGQAIDYAFQHGYNLIVERSEGSSTLFDVMLDPDGSCTAGLNLELLNTEEEVLVEPYAEGWTTLMLRTFWELVKRLDITARGFCTAQMVPRLRQAASSSRPAIERATHFMWRRITRASSVGAHSPSWHSSIPASCRVKAFSLSTARVRAKRIVARAAAVYRQEVFPFCRTTASRCWWSNPAVAFRRWWRTHLHGSISDAARRLAAEGSVLYAREVAPRLHHALNRYRKVDIQGVCRRAWTITLLTAINLTDQFAAAVAALYVRRVAPRLRQAAARYQQADFEGTLRRSIEAVAPAQHSNSSQLS